MKIDAFKNGDFAHGVNFASAKQFAWLDHLEGNSLVYRRAVDSWPKLANPNENVILLEQSEESLQNSPLSAGWVIANPPNRFMIWLEPVK